MAIAIKPGNQFSMNYHCDEQLAGDMILGESTLLYGRLQDTGGWIDLEYSNKPPSCPAPKKLFRLRVADHYFLLDEKFLLDMVNAINDSGELWATNLLQRHPPDANALPFLTGDSTTALPDFYRKRVLATPVVGKITAVSRISTQQHFNTGNAGGPPKYWMNSAHVTLDLGTIQGVFVGMHLYSGEGEFEIERAEAEHSEASISWNKLDHAAAPVLGARIYSSRYCKPYLYSAHRKPEARHVACVRMASGKP